jgi:hypothetical protein
MLHQLIENELIYWRKMCLWLQCISLIPSEKFYLLLFQLVRDYFTFDQKYFLYMISLDSPLSDDILFVFHFHVFVKKLAVYEKYLRLTQLGGTPLFATASKINECKILRRKGSRGVLECCRPFYSYTHWKKKDVVRNLKRVLRIETNSKPFLGFVRTRFRTILYSYTA